MFNVTFTGHHEITLEVEQEQSLLLVAKRAGVPLTHRCGGHARCGTCRVRVVEGGEHLTERGETETRILDILKADPDERLACQSWVRGDVTIRVERS